MQKIAVPLRPDGCLECWYSWRLDSSHKKALRE